VRYVKNITDVGHMRDDQLDSLTGPEKVEQAAETEGITKRLVENGLAYEVDGTIYYDVSEFPGYGQQSGQRVPDRQWFSHPSANLADVVDNRPLRRNRRSSRLASSRPGSAAWDDAVSR